MSQKATLFFTSDTHLGHDNCLDFDQRPFSNIEEHDEAIIQNTLDIMKPGDILWHLGDVAWYPDKAYRYYEALRKHGVQVFLIRGNHDDRGGWPHRDMVTGAYESKYLKNSLTDQFVPGIHLSHYGIRSWRNIKHGTWHLYGHSHGRLPAFGKSFDVGVMLHGYKPLPLEYVAEIMDRRPSELPEDYEGDFYPAGVTPRN